MATLFLLVTVTVLYAAYNLLVKASSLVVAEQATTLILATICLQIAALTTSLIFAAVLVAQGGHVFHLPTRAYHWALAAGLCIGGAEIAYFYLFSGLGHGQAMPASTAIPVIVAGTIVLTVIVSHFVFKEAIGGVQLLGAGLVMAGIYLLFFKQSAA